MGFWCMGLSFRRNNQKIVQALWITINWDESENGKLHCDLSLACHSPLEDLDSKVFDLITMKDDTEDDFDRFFHKDC